MTSESEKESVAMALMTVVTMIFYFLPLLNGLAGGLAGGYKVGDLKGAAIAAIIPVILVSAFLAGLFIFTDQPVLGLYGREAGLLVIVLSDMGILAGAVLGGWLAEAGEQKGSVSGPDMIR
ncbi:MAG: hypothetical protein JWO30_4022 [Fibrobacteres bacterium]|nr:hypothetical protein [Fibrobacterota bacterium]